MIPSTSFVHSFIDFKKSLLSTYNVPGAESSTVSRADAFSVVMEFTFYIKLRDEPGQFRKD